MVGISFLFSSLCVFIGLAILAIDPWLEPTLRNHPFARVFGSFIFVSLGVLFGWEVVWFPAELNMASNSFAGNYDKGKIIYGIQWDDDMSDLRVVIGNPTGRDFDKLDLRIGLPDNKQIRGYGAIQSFPHVEIIPTETDVHQNIVDDSGTPIHEDIISARGSPEVRVICERLPKHTSINLIFAVSDYVESIKLQMSNHKSQFTNGRMESLVIHKPSDGKIWVRSRATFLQIDGEYSVTQKMHDIRRTLSVNVE